MKRLKVSGTTVELSQEMKERTAATIALAVKLSDTRKIFREIRIASERLAGLLWSEDEIKEKDEVIENFDGSMQAMVYYTIKNLEAYQMSNWMELFDREGEADEFK
ncbi:hypothetical protein FRZ06_08540 [Anoxybacterium hadale]|uniref:Uncharacterized protein n=1 Tax=Anoxybacterium hadale TaxID=3408580 RepID=A0ACD1AA76_9FIRM|nr:hypothetical protein FRZ06_08540 [Clostridiales bacterium]